MVLLVASVNRDVKKLLQDPSDTATGGHLSRRFHGAYTHITKCAKNTLPPETQLRSSSESVDLTYFLSQNQIPQQVRHLTSEAVSHVTAPTEASCLFCL